MRGAAAASMATSSPAPSGRLQGPFSRQPWAPSSKATPPATWPSRAPLRPHHPSIFSFNGNLACSTVRLVSSAADQGRPVATAALSEVSTGEGQAEPTDTGEMRIKEALELSCERLGRSYDQKMEQLGSVLEDNWYTTLTDVSSLGAIEATALGIPLRLLKELQSLAEELRSGRVIESDSRGPNHKDAATATNLVQGPCIGEPPALAGKSYARSYNLKETETSKKLEEEIDDFFRFCTVPSFKRQTAEVRPVTARKYCHIIRRVLGWMHRFEEVALNELSLKLMAPTMERSGAEVAFQYLQWLEGNGLSPNTVAINAYTFLIVAQYLYHKESQAVPAEGDKPYSDIPVVREIRCLTKGVAAKQKNAGYVVDENLKWLDWPQYLQVVQTLKTEFEDSLANPSKTRKETATKLQTYLMFSIMACIPDRQRTLRELKEGTTLMRDAATGSWAIKHGPEDYKTGKAYGDRPLLYIAPHIGPDLELWLRNYRKEFAPHHKYVFTLARGGPFDSTSVHRLFSSTCYRLTGQQTNPHLLRDSIVTFLRSGDASEKELDALAMYMGHSPTMQRNVYDRRTKDEKVSPAIEILHRLLGIDE
eukprot:CAMPEP_0117688120 /NCGR_PEP_ID=MMETSP0804-20121206/23611_1 /TAXON_ID=1074897 /ORGANISM="Tetraselmis astigmatica, Strain CCMP880" /LENGTH=591 /DNA_ID=CAMNT_0005500453 /DNA_START=320 /DNA_END=2095 /DNA_ORIENTATION=+